jgi:hypothetical protein
MKKYLEEQRITTAISYFNDHSVLSLSLPSIDLNSTIYKNQVK